MLWKSILAASPLLLGSLAHAAEPASQDPSRGELLYSTYCVACHDTQVHWRDKKLATNWPSLLAEVDRWQGISKLGWSEDDVATTARYLNRLYYNYSTPD